MVIKIADKHQSGSSNYSKMKPSESVPKFQRKKNHHFGVNLHSIIYELSTNGITKHLQIPYVLNEKKYKKIPKDITPSNSLREGR